eukprot:CAMPEP_0115867874 /NCGR_PEP_ID=MMETSP0287-20121206/20993_1 /TAXON_ID=412157 /ORGANISM="Chrysochromulina rotalis, Strain UIO044" /LENGTH=54 /DNA_ID=CAMNT_0003322493 /DNA_START=1358 /DNA_END=1522 /DNA_ORIENTATION=-
MHATSSEMKNGTLKHKGIAAMAMAVIKGAFRLYVTRKENSRNALVEMMATARMA